MNAMWWVEQVARTWNSELSSFVPVNAGYQCPGTLANLMCSWTANRIQVIGPTRKKFHLKVFLSFGCDKIVRQLYHFASGFSALLGFHPSVCTLIAL